MPEAQLKPKGRPRKTPEIIVNPTIPQEDNNCIDEVVPEDNKNIENYEMKEDC